MRMVRVGERERRYLEPIISNHFFIPILEDRYNTYGW